MDAKGKKKNVGETCIICEEKKEKGIHVNSQFICYDCEKEMISIETNDEKYKYYLEKLRKVIQPMLNTQ